MLTYVVIGFFTVFGWNAGQKVWDKYVEPEIKIEKATVQHDTRRSE